MVGQIDTTYEHMKAHGLKSKNAFAVLDKTYYKKRYHWNAVSCMSAGNEGHFRGKSSEYLIDVSFSNHYHCW